MPTAVQGLSYRPYRHVSERPLIRSCARTRAASKLSQRCVTEELGAVVGLAASWHDVGKLDERFQLMLHHGDEIAAAAAEAPLAKSAFIPESTARRRAVREASRLPEDFRHELLSAQLAE